MMVIEWLFIVMGVPQNRWYRWFISWKIPKWMITRGTPIWGNPQMVHNAPYIFEYVGKMLKNIEIYRAHWLWLAFLCFFPTHSISNLGGGSVGQKTISILGLSDRNKAQTRRNGSKPWVKQKHTESPGQNSWDSWDVHPLDMAKL